MRALAVAAALFALSTTLVATTFLPLSFEQLVDGSPVVVYGRVTDVRAQWAEERRFIESIVTFDVIESIKGASRETITFSVPGGQIGRYLNVIPGSPVFTTGDLAVVFLTSRGARVPVTTGLTQGVYRVQRESGSGRMLVTPPSIGVNGPIVRGDAIRKPVALAAFEESIRAASR